MLPCTNAARFPNIGRKVTAGPSGTSLVNAVFASSLGLGIAPFSIGLIGDLLPVVRFSTNDVPWRSTTGPTSGVGEGYVTW